MNAGAATHLGQLFLYIRRVSCFVPGVRAEEQLLMV